VNKKNDLICGLPYTLTIIVPELKRKISLLLNKTEGKLIYATISRRFQEDLLLTHLEEFFKKIKLCQLLNVNDNNVTIKIILKSSGSYYYHQEKFNTQDIPDIPDTNILFDCQTALEEVAFFIQAKIYHLIKF